MKEIIDNIEYFICDCCGKPATYTTNHGNDFCDSCLSSVVLKEDEEIKEI